MSGRRSSSVWWLWRLLLPLTLLAPSPSHQHGSGAPPAACVDQMPRHADIQPQSSVPPYVILTSNSQVRQGDLLNVTVGSPAGAPLPIGGFILQARSIQKQDQIVGRFVSVPDPDGTHIISCRGDNDTVTHSSPEDKPAMTFQWLAPTDFLGGVEFRATVAQTYAVFWRNVESALVEVVTPDTNVISAVKSPAPELRAATTPAPPVLMESKPAPAPTKLDSIYSGCADTKLCYGVPDNCIPAGNCKAVVAVHVAGDTYTFELQGSDNPKYVAAGLSVDNKMGDDSAVECVRQDNGRVTIHTSWTYPKVEPYVSRSQSPQDIVRLLQSSTIDGKLYCRYTRDAVSTVNGRTIDLPNNQYNLMVLAGSSMKDADRVGFHDLVYEATGQPLSLAVVGTAAGSSKLLLKLHGSFMLVAWLGAASIGIMLARYFRQTWVGKQLGGKDIWFAWHRVLMMTTWLLTMSSFVLIMVEVGGWQLTGDNPHAVTGLTTTLLCFLQPIGAYFRPHPGTKRRALFNWTHWLLGNAAHILAIATIFLAVYLQKAELPPWSIYILAAYVVFHVLVHIMLSLCGCMAEGKLGSARVDTFPMKDMTQRTPTATGHGLDTDMDSPLSRFRKLVLGVYAPLVLLVSAGMVCLVALAPIATTYDTIMGS